MLAQNFKSAEALGLPEDLYTGLIKTLGMLERGELIRALRAYLTTGQPDWND